MFFLPLDLKKSFFLAASPPPCSFYKKDSLFLGGGGGGRDCCVGSGQRQNYVYELMLMVLRERDEGLETLQQDTIYMVRLV